MSRKSFGEIARELGKPFLSGPPYNDHCFTTGSVENLWICVCCGFTTEHPSLAGYWCRKHGRTSTKTDTAP